MYVLAVWPNASPLVLEEVIILPNCDARNFIAVPPALYLVNR
jgi:hypothetical protein